MPSLQLFVSERPQRPSIFFSLALLSTKNFFWWLLGVRTERVTKAYFEILSVAQ
jgi:hypothetical protein